MEGVSDRGLPFLYSRWYFVGVRLEKQKIIFSTLDTSNLWRGPRHRRHNKQLQCNFGSRPLDTLKKSVLGLCRVYNLLPAVV